MCTAVSYRTKGFYFGRTLDYDMSYGHEITVTPRRFPFDFRMAGQNHEHYAMIGMAHVAGGYPLYYDAVNEKGLAMAGLNFPKYAAYGKPISIKDNICQFEFIPWILSRCATLAEARRALETVELIDTPFSPDMPIAPLHWMISDRTGDIVVESVKEGLKIYDDPVGVMTNSPSFDVQLFNLNNYMSLTPYSPRNNFADGLNLDEYCRGLGAMGLPGDLSSMSRFVRAAFVKMNSLSNGGMDSVSQFFHILGSVDQQRGCCRLGEGKCEVTLYTSCCDAEEGVYYYTTYNNHQISAVDMRAENLDSSALSRFSPVEGERIYYHNR